MKHFIQIAYFFPPEGSAGTHRPLRFARHLPRTGWMPTVISAEPYRYERPDPELLQMVPREIEVVRVRARDLWQAIQAKREERVHQQISTGSSEVSERIRAKHHAPFRTLLRKAVRAAEAHHYRPDFARHWIKPATGAALAICKRKAPKVIWATAGPVSAWLVARRISDRTGIPYVLDLRDPWGVALCESEFEYPDRLQRQLQSMMYGLLRGAKSVVLLSDVVAEAYSRAFSGALDPSRIHIIPNGYDGALENHVAARGDKLTILYAGTIFSYRYDTLLEALAILKTADAGVSRVLQLRFVGEGMEHLARHAARLGVADLLEISGPVPLADVTRMQSAAHALLVLGRPSSMNGHELFTSAKVFAYLKARRPVCAVLPRDGSRRVLTSVGVSTIADVESPQAIASMLRELIAAWSSGSLETFLPDQMKCESYSAERQTEALSRCLDGEPATEPFVAGSVDLPPSLRQQLSSSAVVQRGLRWT